MKVSSIRLAKFKRFTDLQISEIPDTAKLVLIVGPNGSGKSSLFDAFMHWYRQTVRTWGVDQDKLFYQKGDEADFSWNETVSVETHGSDVLTKGSLYVRTAYRNDPDFKIGSLSQLQSPADELRVSRSIQNDQTVSQNYQRLIYETIAGVYNAGNDRKTVEELRGELIGALRKSMTAVFGDLELNDIADPLGNGTFYFKKGTSKSYHYKNLSGWGKGGFRSSS